ncbi:MAG: two-component system response regulator [Gammaproteobacteria bacterium]|nr:MAG: two-component system response regulator [Gammaproteobacteria bacterium]RLA15232.1 MAG: two-component system response regulator [Gammaproteobacteria bacterium]
MADAQKLLIIDDDPVFSTALARALSNRGYQVETVHDVDGALRQCEQFLPVFVVLDLRLGEGSGLQIIEPMLALNPTLHILMLTGFASIATAVHAIKLGAADYLAKPVDAQMVDQALQQKTVIFREPEAEVMSVERLEWEHIQRALADHDGNVSAAARALKMHRRTLQRKLAKRPRRQ